ncbi:AAA family ATPase [candidate division KSB1 bacterium]|nr:AAA family ATPase [candidate division KSB1 bacterium]
MWTFVHLGPKIAANSVFCHSNSGDIDDMPSFTTSITLLLIGLSLGLYGKKLWLKLRARRKDLADGGEVRAPDDVARLYEIAASMQDFFQKTANPADVLASAEFQRGVRLLEKPVISIERVLEYCSGGNHIISCMALRALLAREKSEEHIAALIDNLDQLGGWAYYFALQVIVLSDRPVLGAVLVKAQEWWMEYKVFMQSTNDFIKKRLDNGEALTFGEHLGKLSEDAMNQVEKFLLLLEQKLATPFLDEINARRAASLDIHFLNTVGRVWDQSSFQDVIIEHEMTKQTVEKIAESLFSSPQRSVLLVGESGVGKSAMLQLLFKRLENHWRIFQAGAVDIIAGQIYIGELEARIQNLIKKLDVQKRVLWYIPNFHQLVYTGRHRYSATGILDMLLPYIESGKIKIIGETHPTANEQIERDNKRVHTLLDIYKIEPLDDANALNLAKKWAQMQLRDGEPAIADGIFREALHLSKQFLNSVAPPGNLFQFLKMAQRQLLIEGRALSELKTDDLYRALSQLSGLPRSILDEQAGLDLNALRDLFHQRVLGQREAIDCLVERVAMIKAGLTDPTRPFGVFLFAGPTGTGKTAMAKTLAEFLFGSPERMIRLDMSEYQSPDSVGRILGSGEENKQSLASMIRKQPFSVVLLDEFEKSDLAVWDLFLQVFDDGRMTDKGGTTSDFRHTIIIMTSNLGGTIRAGASIGFDNRSDVFSFTSVQKSISKTFRREFINRIDRVVIFHPLDRSTMRRILYNELNNALQRRGLRSREWAVEWEESAVNFLLEKGFTPDLGARPLKRAIERYLLAPLALTIVSHQFPEGDQFLFVKSDGARIQVEFIDPDAGEEEQLELTPEKVRPPHLSLKSIVLEPKRTADELNYLESCYVELNRTIRTPKWEELKAGLLTAMSAKAFWDSPARFKTLGDVEFMDRIESGLRAAESLLGRIERTTLPKNLIALLAQQLYLLGEAHQSYLAETPQDAFLKIESKARTAEEQDLVHPFAQRLKEMYVNWAKKRLMKCEILQERFDDSSDCLCIMAISGFAAYPILAPESGMHVLEVVEQEKKWRRYRIHIRVAPQAMTPESSRDGLLTQAVAAFAASDEKPRIIRRYQTSPTPLVRDSVRKWRTGKLERVLEGDFDVMG